MNHTTEEEFRREIAELRNRIALYDTLLEKMGKDVFHLNGEGVLVSLSETLLSLYGYPQDEVLNRPFIERIDPGDHLLWNSTLEEVRTGGQATTTLRILSSTRAPLAVQHSLYGLFENGKLHHILGVSHGAQLKGGPVSFLRSWINSRTRCS